MILLSRILTVLSILLVASSCANKAAKVNHTKIGKVFHDESMVSFILAAAAGDINKADGIFSKGINLEYKGEAETTPLAWMVLSESLEGVEYLLEKGASPDEPSVGGFSPIGLAARDARLELLEVMLAHGGDPDFVNKDHGKETPIFECVSNLDVNGISILLDYLADINHRNIYGDTPLMVAGALNRFDIVLLLLEQGADHRIEDMWGNTIVYFIEENRTNAEGMVYKNKVKSMLMGKGVVFDE